MGRAGVRYRAASEAYDRFLPTKDEPVKGFTFEEIRAASDELSAAKAAFDEAMRELLATVPGI